jgi:flagellar biosynthetic protein FliS
MTAVNSRINAEDYALRIKQASPAQLVVINYALVTEFLRGALESLDGGDKEAFAFHVDKAKDGLMKLIGGLNFEITLAHELYAVYRYLYERLTGAFFRYERKPVEEALSLTEILAEGFRDAVKQQPAEASAGSVQTETAPQVFAGLTYERDGLAEYIDQKNERGYRA